MDEAPTSPDLERELRDLRARAYGPDSDIQDDPVALARLAELEARRARGAPPPLRRTSTKLATADAAPVDLEEDARLTPIAAGIRRHEVRASRRPGSSRGSA